MLWLWGLGVLNQVSSGLLPGLSPGVQMATYPSVFSVLDLPGLSLTETIGQRSPALSPLNPARLDGSVEVGDVVWSSIDPRLGVAQCWGAGEVGLEGPGPIWLCSVGHRNSWTPEQVPGSICK